MKNLKIIIGIFALIVVVFLIAKGGYKKSEDTAERANTTQSSALEIRANDWVLGTSTAKVTIVEYLDFECEACGAYYPITTKIKEEYKDDVRLVIRYFPLPGHKNSRTAAYAVESAGKQGKFWEMRDLLFQNASKLEDANLKEYAKNLGLDVKKFND